MDRSSQCRIKVESYYSEQPGVDVNHALGREDPKLQALQPTIRKVTKPQPETNWHKMLESVEDELGESRNFSLVNQIEFKRTMVVRKLLFLEY